MKRPRILLTFFVTFLNSILIFATNSIFTYDKQQLQNTFAELSSVESQLLQNDLPLEEFVLSRDSIYEAPASMLQSDKCSRAKMDAKLQYKPTGPALGTFCCTAGTNPLFGLVLIYFVNKEVPKDSNLGIRDYSMMSDNDYMTCYRLAALDKKKKSVWGAFAIGTVIYLVWEIYYFTTVYPSL